MINVIYCIRLHWYYCQIILAIPSNHFALKVLPTVNGKLLMAWALEPPQLQESTTRDVTWCAIGKIAWRSQDVLCFFDWFRILMCFIVCLVYYLWFTEIWSIHDCYCRDFTDFLWHMSKFTESPRPLAMEAFSICWQGLVPMWASRCGLPPRIGWIRIFQKIGEKTPKWMVKIMENPIFQWMIWGENPTIFGNIHFDIEIYNSWCTEWQ